MSGLGVQISGSDLGEDVMVGTKIYVGEDDGGNGLNREWGFV